MRPDDVAAEEIKLVGLSSAFLDSFDTAIDAPTLLMTDVGVTWRRSAIPS